MKVIAATGGGIRGVVHPRVLNVGVRTGKLNLSEVDYYMGDSSGSLMMAMVASGMKLEDMEKLLINTPFASFFNLPFIPWDIRKAAAPLNPISFSNFAKWIDSLKLPITDKLFVNSWDSKANKHTIFCEKKPDNFIDDNVYDTVWVEGAFSTYGYGKICTRSMALPGLVADDPKWKDGGAAGHPPIAILPRDTEVFLSNLGYAGMQDDTEKAPVPFIENVILMYEVTAFGAQRRLYKEFPNLHELNPKVYNIDTTAFNLTSDQKLALMNVAESIVTPQWQSIQPLP